MPKFEHSDIVETKVGQSYYESCFEEKGDMFEFALNDATIDDTVGTDNQTLKDGDISATLLDIKDFGGR